MVSRLGQSETVNVLLTGAEWRWPQAVTQIFRPRGINSLLAVSEAETVRLVTNNVIHLAILDSSSDSESFSATRLLRTIRNHKPLLPCILLARQTDDRLLTEALALGAFSVLAKPVDLQLLGKQINTLFVKRYQSHVFSPKTHRQSATNDQTDYSGRSSRHNDEFPNQI